MSLLVRIPGIMLSNKTLVKCSRKIGEKICDTMKASNGEITTEQIGDIIRGVIGKRNAKKIHILETKEKAIDYAVKNGLPAKDLTDMYGNIAGVAIPSKYKREAGLHIRNPQEFIKDGGNPFSEGIVRAQVVTHEVEHVLANVLGKDYWYKKFSKIPCVKKYIDKQERLRQELKFQDVYNKLYTTAIETNNFNIDKAKELVADVIGGYHHKDKLFIIKNLERIFKDESRAYNVGFDAATKYSGVNFNEHKNKATGIFENLVEALKYEKNNKFRMRTLTEEELKKYCDLGDLSKEQLDALLKEMG